MTTATPLDERYFSWLYSRVRATRDGAPGMSYAKICSRMHQVKFNWSVPNDDNRAADGKELRELFLDEEEHRDPGDYDEEWLGLDASVFEVLVALCHRANYMIDADVEQFFETLLINLKLTDCFDAALTNAAADTRVARIIEKFNERQYSRSGQGGLFPLKHPSKDQREVEIWYQMAEYMTENQMY